MEIAEPSLEDAYLLLRAQAARDRAGVAAAVVGPRTLSQLEQILDVEVVELPPKIREALDDATSTPVH